MAVFHARFARVSQGRLESSHCTPNNVVIGARMHARLEVRSIGTETKVEVPQFLAGRSAARSNSVLHVRNQPAHALSKFDHLTLAMKFKIDQIISRGCVIDSFSEF